VAIPQRPSDAGKCAKVSGADFDQCFGLGRHLHEVAGVEQEGVAVAQQRGLSEIDEQLRAFGAEESATTVAPPFVIEDHRIHHPGGIELMAAEQLYRAQHRSDWRGVATPPSQGKGSAPWLSLSGSRGCILMP
jgi:hypothetical protein